MVATSPSETSLPLSQIFAGLHPARPRRRRHGRLGRLAHQPARRAVAGAALQREHHLVRRHARPPARPARAGRRGGRMRVCRWHSWRSVSEPYAARCPRRKGRSDGPSGDPASITRMRRFGPPLRPDGADLLLQRPARPQLGPRGVGHDRAQAHPCRHLRHPVVPVVARARLPDTPARRRSRSRCSTRRATSGTRRSPRAATARPCDVAIDAAGVAIAVRAR